MFKILIGIILTIAFLSVYLRYFEYKSLYFPMKEIELAPSAANLSYEDIYFDTEDAVKLNAWFIPAKDSKCAILFCHGNGGNISHRIGKILILNGLDLDVFIFDYRGYGKSSGRPSEQGLYKDARAAYDYLVNARKILPSRIVLYGESLGGAVAVDIAARRLVKALILESVFSSAPDVARVVYPFFPAFFISSKFDTANKIKKIDIPKLIMHSRNDEIIPFTQSQKIFNAALEPKRHLVLIGSHNNCYMDSRDLYITGIRKFLEDL